MQVSKDMQQKKNIRLLIIWAILVVVTIAIAVYKPSGNRLDIDKAHFALGERVNQVTKITITSSTTDIRLTKKGRSWVLNESLSADMNKVNDLLGVMSEVSVRRKINENTDNLAAIINVSVYDDSGLLSSFAVSENESETLTMFTDDNTYVVNIPGYQYHIADLFQLPVEEWRSKYVFASNWTTLDKMIIQFPKQPENNFEIVYDNQGYLISGITQLDTTAMYGYMQQVSFLQLQSYTEQGVNSTPDLNIVVKDVGTQQISLDFYLTEERTLGQINNNEWAIFDRKSVESLIKSKAHFIKN